MKRTLLLLLLSLCGGAGARAEAYLREGDVISFVGAEDMVVAAERGQVELGLTLRNPALHLRFRSLAREGDTVFEQHRDLNYPVLEDQLTSTGTTVFIAEFGQMERLAGVDPAKFAAAYEELLERLSGHGTRRGVLIASAYGPEVQAIAQRRGWPLFNAIDPLGGEALSDGAHLNRTGQARLANWSASLAEKPGSVVDDRGLLVKKALLDLITAKNQLWYHYYRPQNWAFLAGDRTNQPSSRDYRDPTKRWFPAEMQQFLPLIEEKEKEIAAAVTPAP